MLVRTLDWRDPEACFALWQDDPFVAWLDSQGPVGKRSRFSFLAVEPFRILLSGDGGTTLDGVTVAADPFDVLAAEMAAHRLDGPGLDVPFMGGAVGFLGYELAHLLERVPCKSDGALGIPDMAAAFFDTVFVFDRAARRTWLISSGLPAPEGPARDARAVSRADDVLARLTGKKPSEAPALPALRWRRETSREAHEAGVARVQRYIAAGDIYQANLTCRFVAGRPAGLAAADIYHAVRGKNPAPFGAFLGCGPNLAIASASPERFVSLDAGGLIETRPIKGTRKRGANEAEDARLREELVSSGKDRAENLMIVDLLRHDLGRVAAIGSVSVPEFCQVESFAHVHHLVSAVQARLAPGLGAVDLLRAVFPGGSITGAPKIRAMEIIAELECSARGPYCGAIFWLGWDGAMDSSIAIRTVTIARATVAVQAGGGIVADSDPGDEFLEMMTKVRPLLLALGKEPA